MRRALLSAGLFFSAAPVASACSVCFSATDENRAAFLGTTIFLTLLPLSLLVALALWVKHARPPQDPQEPP